jgi:hypothetical protein
MGAAEMITNPMKIRNKLQAPVRQAWREVEKNKTRVCRK